MHTSSSEFLLVDVDDLVIDQNNIRQTANPAYRQIKDSIRSDQGETLLFPVARPDEQSPWMVVGGYGSRLRAIKELKDEWAGSGDNPYSTVRCHAVKETAELPLVIAGLRENSARGDMCYTELSLAVHKSRVLWDANQDGDSSDTSFLAFLRESGMSISATSYTQMKVTAVNLFPLLPEWLLQGRANAERIKCYCHFRSLVVNAISSPPDWINLSVELNKKGARQFFDQHFQTLAPTADSATLDWKKDLQTPMIRRLASALNISSVEFNQLISGKHNKRNKKTETTPVFNAFSEALSSPTPKWEMLAQSLVRIFTNVNTKFCLA